MDGFQGLVRVGAGWAKNPAGKPWSGGRTFTCWVGEVVVVVVVV